MTIPKFLTDPGWVAVILVLATWGWGWGQKLWRKATTPYEPRTQNKKDRKNYGLLLNKYENYLNLLEDTIVIRAQHKHGPDPYTPELEQTFVETRDRIFSSLEKRAEHEDEMGVFQLLDILEERMVRITDLRKRRDELRARQVEIENHPLFVRRHRAA